MRTHPKDRAGHPPQVRGTSCEMVSHGSQARVVRPHCQCHTPHGSRASPLRFNRAVILDSAPFYLDPTTRSNPDPLAWGTPLKAHLFRPGSRFSACPTGQGLRRPPRQH